jgi:HSP20 family protein
MAGKKIYLEELARIQNQINSLFEQALLSSGVGPDEDDAQAPGRWAPAVDILETEEAFLLFAELPGVEKDAIELHVSDGQLELSGMRTPAEGETFLRLERSYGEFRRSFRLGAGIDGDAVTARFRAGVLEVVVPKRMVGRAVDVEEAR